MTGTAATEVRPAAGSPPRRSGRARVLGVVRWFVALALLTFLVRSDAIDWAGMAGLWRAWPITALAVGVLLLNVVVTSYRACVLMTPRGLHLSLPASVRLSLIGFFFNTALPGASGGDIVRIYYAARGNEGRRTEVATVLLFDRAIGMFALVTWPLLAYPFVPAGLRSHPVLDAILAGALVLAAGMMVGLAVAFTPGARHNRLVRWVFRLPLGAYVEQIFETVHGYRRSIPHVLAAVVISLVAHTLMVTVIALLAMALAPEGFGWQMIVVVPLGFLANVLPVTPGGLGVGEVAFDRLFRLAGLQGGAEALLAWRVAMLPIVFLGFLVYLPGRKEFVRAAGQPAGARATA